MFASQLSVSQFIWMLNDSPVNDEIYRIIDRTRKISANRINVQFRNYGGRTDLIGEIIGRLGSEYSYSAVGDEITDLFDKHPSVEFWLWTNRMVQWLRTHETEFRRLKYRAVIDTHLDCGIPPRRFDELMSEYLVIPKEDVGCVHSENCLNHDSEIEASEFIGNLVEPNGMGLRCSFVTHQPQLNRIMGYKTRPIWIKEYPRCAMVRKNVCIGNGGEVFGCVKRMNPIGIITDDFQVLKRNLDKDLEQSVPKKCKECPNRVFCGSCSFRPNQTMCDQTETCFRIINDASKLTEPIEL